MLSWSLVASGFVFGVPARTDSEVTNPGRRSVIIFVRDAVAAAMLGGDAGYSEAADDCCGKRGGGMVPRSSVDI